MPYTDDVIATTVIRNATLDFDTRVTIETTGDNCRAVIIDAPTILRDETIMVTSDAGVPTHDATDVVVALSPFDSTGDDDTILADGVTFDDAILAVRFALRALTNGACPVCGDPVDYCQGHGTLG